MEGNKNNLELINYISSGEYEKAEYLLQFILGKHKDTKLMNLLALIKYKYGAFKESKRLLQESYKIDKNEDAKVYLNKYFDFENIYEEYYEAIELCKNGKYNKAKRTLEYSLEKKYNIPQIYELLAMIYYKEKEYKRALECSSKVKRLHGYYNQLDKIETFISKNKSMRYFTYTIYISISYVIILLLYLIIIKSK